MSLKKRAGLWVGSFSAMASPCELLVDGGSRTVTQRAFQAVVAEARRIEQKYSRYREDNLVHRLHHAQGAPVTVDTETARLLDFGALAWELSEGRFDLSSGVLREVWRFDGSDNVPSPEAVEQVMQRVGWTRLSWEAPVLTLPAGMQIDFGGIGKEYAVDRALAAAAAIVDNACLVNFGGDLRVSGPRRHGEPWTVGVEGSGDSRMSLHHGALATSGDARRFLLRDGVRYSHILDARTGWPVPHAPHSVTVASENCIEAGLFATLASLQGADAETFLQAQGVVFQIIADESSAAAGPA